MQKGLSSGLLIATLLVTLVGCGSGSNASTTTDKPKDTATNTAATNTPAKIDGKGKTIGVSSLYTGSDWNAFLADEIKKDLKAQGFKVIYTNAGGETRQQVADVENLIQTKVDGIIIAGGEGRAFFDSSLKAKAAGISVVGVDMYLPGAVSTVATDNYSGGTQMGLFLINAMNREGKIIILDTAGWQTLAIRKRMATSTFAEFPNMKVIGNYDVGVSDPVNLAYNIVKGAIRNNPDLKGVLTTWSLPVVGAIKAIKEMNMTNQITVVGTNDGDRITLAAVGDPGAPVSGTMAQNPRELGDNASELIAKATTGVTDLPSIVMSPTYMVTRGDPKKSFTEMIRVTPAEMWAKLYPDVKRPF